MAHMMTRKRATLLRNLGFDPDFTLKIERNAHLNFYLIPNSGNLLNRRQSTFVAKATPKKSCLKQRRMTTSTPKNVKFRETVTVTTLKLNELSPVQPVNNEDASTSSAANIRKAVNVPNDSQSIELAATGSKSVDSNGDSMGIASMVNVASTSAAVICNAVNVPENSQSTELAATASKSADSNGESMGTASTVNDVGFTVTNGTVQPSDSLTDASSTKPAAK